jgi:hypothetical protein
LENHHSVIGRFDWFSLYLQSRQVGMPFGNFIARASTDAPSSRPWQGWFLIFLATAALLLRKLPCGADPMTDQQQVYRTPMTRMQTPSLQCRSRI